jgi:cbb3-type cytochrome oxidase subunit 3
MDSDLLLVVVLIGCWLACMLYAYAAGRIAGFEEARELKDSEDVRDLLEEENR